MFVKDILIALIGKQIIYLVLEQNTFFIRHKALFWEKLKGWLLAREKIY